MNILYEKLPENITVNGVSYPIYTDFRTWIKVALILEHSTDLNVDVLADIIKICLKKHVKESICDPVAIISELFVFYLCGENAKNTQKATSKQKKQQKNIYSYEHDSKYIYSAFYTQYNIDLTVANMHWWTFKALFDGLCGEHKFCRIVEYRSTDLSKIKDSSQRAHIRKMQSIYRLPDNRTQAEKDADIAAALS